MTWKNERLQQAITIADHAGRLILQWYKNDTYQIVQKTDASPLTEADLASEKYIRSALSGTGIPVVSEETECPYIVRKDWDIFWLVDPLDGTKDFIQRNGEFTVNIALIKNGLPVLGVIHAPAVGLTYYAQKGEGAFCREGGITRKLPFFKPSSDLTATVSRQHLNDTTREFLRINDINKFVKKGSSLKFGTVASGEATIYPRFEGSMEWDIAAGHAILTEAGCRITDLVTGKPPVYNKPSLRNNPFIACSPQIDSGNLNIPEMPITPA
jgi:3'(2'), 5'-bisphosphate nucleotidase